MVSYLGPRTPERLYRSREVTPLHLQIAKEKIHICLQEVLLSGDIRCRGVIHVPEPRSKSS